LEFVVISFNTAASGVFFCLRSLISRRVSVSAFLALLLAIPFFLLQFGCYLTPSLFVEEQTSFVIVCFRFVFNFIFGLIIWWCYLLPLFYFVFVNWFSTSKLAITYIPEITALISFCLFILTSFVFVLQLPSFLFIGIILGFWDTLFLGRNRSMFYFGFVIIGTFISPPEFFIQFGLVFILIGSFEFTLLVSSFGFVSKVF
jgi:sec-independent protein translocase protein TatC